MSEAVLQCARVTVTYANGFCALRDVSLEIAPGECLALVGESGCGKTTLARAALGLLPAGTRISGALRVSGVEVVGASARTLRAVRGRGVGFIAQDPFGACHPLARVADHLAEAWRAHNLSPPAEIAQRATALGIAEAAQRLRQYPHEWSGGMLQRAVVVAATAHGPPLLIADEPTSALDAEHAQAVLALLRARKAALLLISHDLALVARYADRIAVCRAGQIVESGSADEILQRPQHPYTQMLLAAAPRAAQPAATLARAPQPAVVLEARTLSKTYSQGGKAVPAVKEVDLRVQAGEIVGICGPSGCGKSTLLRLLATMETPTGGAVWLGGQLATQAGAGRWLSAQARRGFVMPIFQDPVSSLDRRWPVWRTVSEPLLAAHRAQRPARDERRRIARAYLNRVGLEGIDLEARPAELSVGQCQRVAIARALLASPRLLVADEPTSALDAVSAASVRRLLQAAAAEGTALVVVSHDQRLLRALCHRVLNMHEGALAE